MKTKAVRLYGAMDLRTEEFDLPVITEGEILLTASWTASYSRTAVCGARRRSGICWNTRRGSDIARRRNTAL